MSPSRRIAKPRQGLRKRKDRIYPLAEADKAMRKVYGFCGGDTGLDCALDAIEAATSAAILNCAGLSVM
jgi:hypothetical protein